MIRFGHAARLSVMAIAATCASSEAEAGKGANTYACVNLSVAPRTPVTFTFTPVSTNCMNNTGQAATITASQAGVTCGSIGYVEAQGSGSCAFRSSTWNLSYSSTGAAWSGSTQSTWSTGTGISLSNYSPKTSVNVSAAAGTATSVDWNNQGPLYIIFTPGAANTSAKRVKAVSALVKDIVIAVALTTPGLAPLSAVLTNDLYTRNG